uniref:Uncharacterized protein n=1 Tax=Candidatus Kentrum eta TaxID=2126337 RepID=A0A450V6Q9_9GAMM|nr:MAG: hypothetical protein BECKH772A_GA0070896_101937 [Candidatus Kentron sp. H]VFK04375.1 MAG: hypothetical protein BECKH772B_GA0070898_104374 [Candidatus Kentron sp. H]VFK06601.1 MAG: hypothetical protein BECKH772C_GA0070978_103604 [Candidatus Kentron sp. H]
MRKITTIVSGTLIYWLMAGAVMALPPMSDINVKENIADVDVDEVLTALF